MTVSSTPSTSCPGTCGACTHACHGCVRRKVPALLADVLVFIPTPGQVWNERAYSEDNGDDSIMGRSIRGVKFAQARQ